MFELNFMCTKHIVSHLPKIQIEFRVMIEINIQIPEWVSTAAGWLQNT